MTSKFGGTCRYCQCDVLPNTGTMIDDRPAHSQCAIDAIKADAVKRHTGTADVDGRVVMVRWIRRARAGSVVELCEPVGKRRTGTVVTVERGKYKGRPP